MFPAFKDHISHIKLLDKDSENLFYVATDKREHLVLVKIHKDDQTIMKTISLNNGIIRSLCVRETDVYTSNNSSRVTRTLLVPIFN